MNNLLNYTIWEKVKPDLSEVTQEMIDKWRNLGFLDNLQNPDRITELVCWYEFASNLYGDIFTMFHIYSESSIILPIMRRVIDGYNGDFNYHLYNYYKLIAKKHIKEQFRNKKNIDTEAEYCAYLSKLIGTHKHRY